MSRPNFGKASRASSVRLAAGGAVASGAARPRSRSTARRWSPCKRMNTTKPTTQMAAKTSRNTVMPSRAPDGIMGATSDLQVDDLADPPDPEGHRAERADEQGPVVEQHHGVLAVDHHDRGEGDERQNDQGPALQPPLGGEDADAFPQPQPGADQAGQPRQHLGEVPAGLPLDQHGHPEDAHLQDAG